MYWLELLEKEHEDILDFLESMRALGLGLIEGKEVDTEDIKLAIDFIRDYADKIHHGKEEDYLFLYIQEELGKLGKNLIDHGMLVEHDLARYHTMELEKANESYEKTGSKESKLDIISHLMAYRDLLVRHIDKENRLVYPFGLKSLGSEKLEEIDRKSQSFQSEIQEDARLENYLGLVEYFRNKYRG